MSFFYNDLLFEIYHYIPRSNILLLNKSSKRLQVINERIERYIYHNNDDNLSEACESIDIQSIKKNIRQVAYKSIGLEYACRCGDIKIVKFMIDNGANGANDFIRGLYGACQGAHIKILKFMIKKYIDDWDCNNILLKFDWFDNRQRHLLNTCLYYVCQNYRYLVRDKVIYPDRNSRIKILNFLIRNGANIKYIFIEHNLQLTIFKDT
jgi:hypothetical protein